MVAYNILINENKENSFRDNFWSYENGETKVNSTSITLDTASKLIDSDIDHNRFMATIITGGTFSQSHTITYRTYFA